MSRWQRRGHVARKLPRTVHRETGRSSIANGQPSPVEEGAAKQGPGALGGPRPASPAGRPTLGVRPAAAPEHGRGNKTDD